MRAFGIENVKSFKNSGSIELKPITIFVGPNSSGKSSLMRFPVVLGQTFKQEVSTPLLLNGIQIDYGDFDDVVYGHEGLNFGYSLSFAGKDLEQFIEMDEETQYLDAEDIIEVKIDVFKEEILKVKTFCLYYNEQEMMRLEYTPNGYRLKFFYNSKDEVRALVIKQDIAFNRFFPKIDRLNLKKDIIQKFQFRDADHIAEISDLWDFIIKRYFEGESGGFLENLLFAFTNPQKTLERVKSKLDTEDEQKLDCLVEVVENYLLSYVYLTAIQNYLNNYVNQLIYIGPFRQNPERIYRFSENNIFSVGKKGENSVALLAQAAQREKDLIKKVTAWFEATMNCEINISPIDNSLFKVLIRSKEDLRKGKKGENLIDVGFGIAQVLPIVTQLYHDHSKIGENFSNRLSYFSPDRTYVIEQPELHLHPAAQSCLADLFVEKVTTDYNSRILIETHSEHLLRKLQVLVSDPDVAITNSDVAIYYVEKNADGSSSVQKMELNNRGQFTQKWPTGFFDKSYELSKELIRVSTKPQKS